ncbi:hypothetical protein [Clostridium chromiireducens]|uniref:Uncharacterized protein n=1 Tax=Clostridium chromiireducens TaxID=225345 RepID=A0A1V4IZF5_9CLOT|nr:hypothetical protein [Clostridium chromiireducens]OPJ65306.1 hypothetical protein CLCHR_08820 [Clostridium chromiireducens]
MCTADEKLIYDSYVEGDFATDKLIELAEKHSQILECEIYRGIFLPNILLKIGSNINKYYSTKIMSFSKSLDIAKKFSQRLYIEDHIFNRLKKDGYDVAYHYAPNDNSFFSKVIIRLKNHKSFDLYANYENKVYEREKEVLVLTEPLYIKSITQEGDITFIDCVNEAEFSRNYMLNSLNQLEQNVIG